MEDKEVIENISEGKVQSVTSQKVATDWNAVSAIAASISTFLAFGALIGTIIFSRQQLQLTRDHFERESALNKEFHLEELGLAKKNFIQQLKFDSASRDTTLAISMRQIDQTEGIAARDRKLTVLQMEQNQKQFDSSFILTKKQADFTMEAVLGSIEESQLRQAILHDLQVNIVANVSKMKDLYVENLKGSDHENIMRPVHDILEGIHPVTLKRTFLHTSQDNDIAQLRRVYYNTSLLADSQDLLDAVRNYDKSGAELANEQLRGQIQEKRWLNNRKVDRQNAIIYKQIRSRADSIKRRYLVSFLEDNIAACETIINDSQFILRKHQPTDSLSKMVTNAR